MIKFLLFIATVVYSLELKYVFEIVRHGARAPCMTDNNFPWTEQMLTPMGMRQRYLMGRHNFLKYGK